MTNIYKSEDGERAVQERYRTFLKYWPVPNRQFSVPTRQGETFVVACGDESAPPLLLLHGSGGNAVMWMGDVAAWAKHFRVYAIDMIGEPGLSAPSRPPLESAEYALWLDDVMHALSLQRVSIVGVSLGGWLALDYATRQPERVESLVLLCPGGVGRQTFGEIVFDRQPADAPPAVRKFLEFLTLISENFDYRLEELPIVSDDLLQRLNMPVMAIVGGKDELLDSAETKQRLERNVPQAEVHYLPEAGHVLRGQAAPILEFLRRRGASSATGRPSSRLQNIADSQMGL
jgi:pimeloyl-ACP methyl ester carboxylesterase